MHIATIWHKSLTVENPDDNDKWLTYNVVQSLTGKTLMIIEAYMIF